MSDDLVKRLRNGLCMLAQEEAADRIEELEELRKKTFSALLTATRLHDEAEAKLAKAVDALEFYATQDITYPNVGTVTFHGHDDNGLKARTTLAELTGDKDE